VAVSVISNDKMRRCVMFRSHFMILLTLTFLGFPFAMAQDSEEFDGPLSEKQAKKTVKSAEEALKKAKRAQGREDHPGMERRLEDYSYHMNNLQRGLNDGNVLPDEREDVAKIVYEATYKHTTTLEELYYNEKIPEQGKEGIQHALDVSQRGHDMALENLSRNELLTKKQAKKTLKFAEDALKNAKRAQGREDHSRMEGALEDYTHHMRNLEMRLHEGNILHDEREDVAGVVAEATYKHTNTLRELHENDEIPEQGKEGIKHALDASQRGYDKALENLTKQRQEEVTSRHDRQRGPNSTGQSSGSDHSMGRSSPGAGPGAGRGAGSPGGGSQGGNRGRR
jgi:hypothetical protein